MKIPFGKDAGSDYLPVDAFLGKPFDSAKLAEVVEDTLLLQQQRGSAVPQDAC